ncbi:zinc-dependent alcohol dehydrogenase family protein [Actinomadura kijaniata]|uniref:S-(Hydroxymethyl)glutathione dehydrogenase/alcohol dehydrogenase n=1 Tax=Actinomadura namibiensis TaxID=182080 RepID=A0A7W3QJ53_ACTNM|nr:alcohol dehydrogenase catalytic domain-containing protein [Actinomadura namibiensis]MBA8949016.1 S-(hydroxymethyl)glutathione dehydrogenase/alcohol dehydrogenase [Actinomadura namibiensis]
MARAAVLHAVGDTELDLRDDVTAVDPGPDQVKVKIKATGVCHSDLSTMSGVLPSVPPAVIGHEGAGVVAEVGDRVPGVQVGDHVVINWTPDCGTCPECLRGEPYLCMGFIGAAFSDPRFRIGGDTPAFGMAGVGTWAEEVTLPYQGVIKVAEDVPFEYAALLGCGIPTGVGAAVNTAKVRPGSKVAVVGAGGVGLSVIQGARIAGAATILAVDPNEAKHPLAKQFGATHTATLDDLEEAKGLLTLGQGFDYVFEVVGKSAAITTAWGITRRGGDVIVVGAGAADDNWEMSAFSLLFEGKNVKSSLYGGCDLKRDVPMFVDLWRAGRLDIDGLISRRIRFEDLNDAVRALHQGDVIRQVVLFD